MEPGLRDREYLMAAIDALDGAMLQWSPVLETGNTVAYDETYTRHISAAMEPGLRDREYAVRPQR